MNLKNSNKKDAFIDFLNSGDALFHYTAKDIAIEKILLNKSLKFSGFSNTNDPQEYKPNFPNAIEWGSEGEIESNNVTDTILNIERLRKRMTRFISFCINIYEGEVLKESGVLKSRMWAQYGDNHEGACIILSKRKLLKELDDNKNNHQEILSFPVTYKNPDSRGQPTLHVNKNDFSSETSHDIALNFLLQHREQYLFSKQTDYRDESEFRIICINTELNSLENDEVFFSIENALVGIIFGDKFPKLYAPTIRELVKNLSVTPKKLIWQKDGYYLYDLYNKLET